ncbi:MAG: PHP domain-containing protein [Eubacteriales bacterium]
MTLCELKEIKDKTDAGKIPAPKETKYVNNHIHTTYSFSPYSPAKAVYMAWQNGLKTAGIMDHDSVAGAKEFIQAAAIIKMPVTCGVECRVDMSMTRLNGYRINNPDQKSVAYVAMHGIPHQNIDHVNSFLAPYRAHRNERNIKMCKNITDLVSPYGLSLDFYTDVLPISNYSEGGSVTERHILFALVKKITALYPAPSLVISFLCDEMKLSITEKIKAQILAGDETPDYYEYDILGALKSNMVEKFYIDAADECPAVSDFISMVHENGGIAAYAYLGDVGDSVTGDKKIQKFEDDYLDLLIDVLKEYNFDAITYMPTRNTQAQLDRIMNYCHIAGFFQISGEDINSPRQSFICKALDDPKFGHLIDAAYTLINYENAATENLQEARSEYSYLFAK